MRRTILLSLSVAVLGIASIVGLNTLPVFSSQKASAPKVAVVAAKPSPSVAPKVAATPTPTPTPTPVAKTTATATATASATVVGNSLTIPSIGVNASMVDLALKSNMQIATPSGKSQVGRWAGGGWPGGMGSAVFITGHVQGVFGKLKNMQVGQTLTVKYNGETFTYRVVFKETVKLKGMDMSKPLSVYGGGSEGLNMMTCAGTWNFFNNTYSHRLTIYTVRV